MADLYIRQSELKTWKECRRKTLWQYHDGLVAVNREPGTADTGTLVHTGLQGYYETGVAPAKVLDLWFHAQPELEQVRLNENFVLAHIMLEGYAEWLEATGVDAGFTVVSVEREICVPFLEIGGDTIYITGKTDLEVVDRLERPLLIDHKSVDRIELDGTAIMDEQRLTYAVLRLLEDGTHYAGAIHNQLRRVKRTGTAKPPFYGRAEVTFNLDQLRNHFRHMEGVIRQIHQAYSSYSPDDDVAEHLHFFPNPTKDCSWKCPYLAMCKQRDDGSDWQEYREKWYDVVLPERGRPR